MTFWKITGQNKWPFRFLTIWKIINGYTFYSLKFANSPKHSKCVIASAYPRSIDLHSLLISMSISQSYHSITCGENLSRRSIRQITASATFLPLLNEPYSFDLFVYTNLKAIVPKMWAESDLRYKSLTARRLTLEVSVQTYTRSIR